QSTVIFWPAKRTINHPLRSPPMWRLVSWGLLAVLLSPSLLWAGGDKKDSAKKDDKPLDVDVRFGDGSNVRMVLLQETIDVETKYGKLSVPTRDIRGIDLGVHLPEGAGKKIEAAIKK